MIVLGIETSCDETAAGVVADGVELRANVVASQAALHARYGGVVPELASRKHIEAIVPVVEAALDESRTGWRDVDAVAVTHGPGLAGSLIVGVNAAKGIAASLGVPLIGVNHLEGHVRAAWLGDGCASEAASDPALPAGARRQAQDRRRGECPGPRASSGNQLIGNDPEPVTACPEAGSPDYPLMCLVVSGGHTDLALMRDESRFELVGETRDDAAGEAFDKCARVLGLGYPGGPEIARLAEGAPRIEALPRPWMRDTFDFSFSGLKTALLRRAQAAGIHPDPDGGDPETVAALARELQEAVVDVLVYKAVAAAEHHGCNGIVLGGGVAANRRLRGRLRDESPVPVAIPPAALCTDNGAMIAAAGYARLQNGERSGFDLDVDPGLRLGEGGVAPPDAR